MSSRGGGREALVSVVIPAYNCGAYIAQAVASVLDQDFKDVEAIVVNNNSPDTPLLESELKPYRDRIQYLRAETRGPSAARNAGIRHSHARYLAFLDGDDFWQPGHLSKMMRLFQANPPLALAYCDCLLLKGDRLVGRFFEDQPQAETVNFDSLLTGQCVMVTSAVVVSRDAISKTGIFDEALQRCEDFDLWLRLSSQGMPMAYHTGTEVVHRVTQKGLSANAVEMKKDRIRVYEKVLTGLQVSPEQGCVIRKTIAALQGELYLEQMKTALAAGDYEAARSLAQKTSEVQKNWKVEFTRILMRAAPWLLRQLFLYRARLIGDRIYSTAPLRTALAADADTSDCSRTASRM